MMFGAAKRAWSQFRWHSIRPTETNKTLNKYEQTCAAKLTWVTRRKSGAHHRYVISRVSNFTKVRLHPCINIGKLYYFQPKVTVYNLLHYLNETTIIKKWQGTLARNTEHGVRIPILSNNTTYSPPKQGHRLLSVSTDIARLLESKVDSLATNWVVGSDWFTMSPWRKLLPPSVDIRCFTFFFKSQRSIHV